MLVWTERLMIEAVYRHTKKKLREGWEHNPATGRAAEAALEVIRQRVLNYGEDYFLFSLLLGIMFKKSRMIEEAATKQELCEIVKPSVPIENYGTFRTGPYHVLEEEVILWSKASLEAPLNDVGAGRYREVFTQLFPEEGARIWGRYAA